MSTSVSELRSQLARISAMYGEAVAAQRMLEVLRKREEALRSALQRLQYNTPVREKLLKQLQELQAREAALEAKLRAMPSPEQLRVEMQRLRLELARAAAAAGLHGPQPVSWQARLYQEMSNRNLAQLAREYRQLATEYSPQTPVVREEAARIQTELRKAPCPTAVSLAENKKIVETLAEEHARAQLIARELANLAAELEQAAARAAARCRTQVCQAAAAAARRVAEEIRSVLTGSMPSITDLIVFREKAAQVLREIARLLSQPA